MSKSNSWSPLLPITPKPALLSVYLISLNGIVDLPVAKLRSHSCLPPLYYTVCYQTLLILPPKPIYCDKPVYCFYKWLLLYPGSSCYHLLVVTASALNSSKPLAILEPEWFKSIQWFLMSLVLNPMSLICLIRFCIIWPPVTHSLFLSPFSHRGLLVGLLMSFYWTSQNLPSSFRPWGLLTWNWFAPIFSFSLINSCHL